MSPFTLEEGFHHAAEEHLRGQRVRACANSSPWSASPPAVRGVYAKKRRLKLKTGSKTVPFHRILLKSFIRQF
eukprot:8750590-Karenia_brevis.AAC.1